MKKIFVISASMLLLAACGNDGSTENEETAEEMTKETTELIDSNGDQSGRERAEVQENQDLPENDESEAESQENEGEASRLTEEEAEERVVSYREEQGDPDSEPYEFGMEEEGDVFFASMHTPISTDEKIGSPTLARYEVNRMTGEVREVDVDMGREEPEPYVSEISAMSEEERREHHRGLFAGDGNLEESVLDNLMLPGLHENTETYEGRINPSDTFELFLAAADTPPDYENLNVSPDIEDEDYFTINLTPYNLGNKSVLRFEISGDYPEEQIFDIPIFESQEGMEAISIRD